MDIAQFLRDYGAGIPWVVAMVGWAIANHHANEREKRKEVRSEIDAIEKAVQSIAEKMSAYLQSDPDDQDIKVFELEIIVLFQAVDRRIDRLKKRQKGGTLGLYIDLVEREREQFYDFTTGAYFQTSARLSEPELSQRITDIHSQAHILIEALHTFFLMKFDRIKSDQV